MSATLTIIRKHARATERGVVAIEFAIVVGILLLIIGGIFEFGRAFWYLDALTKGTRDAARYLSTSALPLDTDTATGIVEDAADAARVPDFAGHNYVAITCAPDCTAPARVRVEVTGYPITIGGVVPFFMFGGGTVSTTLNAHTTMRYMQ